MFIRIAVGSLSVAALVATGVAAAGIYARESINRAGGWGWLLIGGVAIAIVTVACIVAVVCCAISLLRREPRPRLATVLLIVCGIEVLRFGGSLAAFARALGPDPNAARVQATAQLSAALVNHFAAANIVLSPSNRSAGFQTDWILEDAGVGSGCVVRVRFRHFAEDTPLDMMKRSVNETTPPLVLNEHARLAIHRPIANSRSADASACDAWSAKAADTSARIVSVFATFRPLVLGDR